MRSRKQTEMHRQCDLDQPIIDNIELIPPNPDQHQSRVQRKSQNCSGRRNDLELLLDDNMLQLERIIVNIDSLPEFKTNTKIVASVLIVASLI
jgi:hypothetical protein